MTTCAQWTGKHPSQRPSFVGDRNPDIVLDVQTPVLQFHDEGFLVDGLEQAGTELAMYLNRAADHRLRQFTMTLRQGHHSAEGRNLHSVCFAHISRGSRAKDAGFATLQLHCDRKICKVPATDDTKDGRTGDGEVAHRRHKATGERETSTRGTNTISRSPGPLCAVAN